MVQAEVFFLEQAYGFQCTGSAAYLTWYGKVVGPRIKDSWLQRLVAGLLTKRMRNDAMAYRFMLHDEKTPALQVNGYNPPG